MSDVVIRVENLSKQYRLGTISHGTLYRDLQSWWARIRGKEDPNSIISSHHSSHIINDRFWALEDISFDVKEGEVLGIIGRNGAGKSTLLKILSRVTAPTRGEVKIKGRVASLLEVGTGFHPELTGRENVYLNGAILGMRKKEIDRKFDEIIDFAEIHKFIDTPVKRYSSGMYVRLAFAVAAHLEPEILIVDEVLAVGDVQFQKKCLGKMEEVGKEGRTVLFVSHNMVAIRSLCNRTILLNAGLAVEDGETSRVITQYLQIGTDNKLKQKWENIETAPGNLNGRFVSAEVETDSGCDDFQITLSSAITFVFKFDNFRTDKELYFNMLLYNQDNVCVFNTSSKQQIFKKGIISSTCKVPPFLLNDDRYTVRILVHYPGSDGIDVNDALTFEVHDTDREGWMGKWTGVVRPHLEWTTQQLEIGQDGNANNLQAAKIK